MTAMSMDDGDSIKSGNLAAPSYTLSEDEGDDNASVSTTGTNGTNGSNKKVRGMASFSAAAGMDRLHPGIRISYLLIHNCYHAVFGKIITC